MSLALCDVLKKRVRHIHFIGAGGIGMSGIAEILCRMGYVISGSDKTANYNTKRLVSHGATIYEGHAKEYVRGADIVVYSSAVPDDNPEAEAAREAGIPLVARAEMLAELMRFKHAVGVAGSHGKTTTTSLVACMLETAGMDPTVINGGIINSRGTNAFIGSGQWVVAEADESDGSFLKLPVTAAIVTNIDPEHLDHYGNYETLLQCFRRFIENIPFYGFATLCVDHPATKTLSQDISSRKIITYGFSEEARVRALNIRTKGHMSLFDVYVDGEPWLKDAEFASPGRHNIQNSLAAVAVARELDVPPETVRVALSTFRGVKRRFTILGRSPAGVTIVDDYAHHPEEIKATLAAARTTAGEGKIIAVVEPHRFSRVQQLRDEFAVAFKDADIAIVKAVYPAGEAPIEGVDRSTLVSAIGRAQEANSEHGSTQLPDIWQDQDITEYVRAYAGAGDYVICMGAGPVTVYAQQLHDALCEST